MIAISYIWMPAIIPLKLNSLIKNDTFRTGCEKGITKLKNTDQSLKKYKMKKEKSSAISRRDFVGTSAKALTAFLILPRYVLGGKRADGSRYIPPSDIISLGFIGTGKQGKGLTTAFLNTGEARIVALSEVYKAKAALTIDRIKEHYQKNTQLGTFSEMPVYNDFRDLLARTDIDAVVIGEFSPGCNAPSGAGRSLAPASLRRAGCSSARPRAAHDGVGATPSRAG